MNPVFTIIFLVSLIPLVLGMIEPKLVIYWGRPEERSRRKVLLSYGIASIVILFFAVSLPGAGTGTSSAAGNFFRQLKLLRSMGP